MNAFGFNVVDNSRGGRQIGGTECGIIAAFNCVALAEAGDSWCTLPAASLGASASQLQLKWAADRAAQWAAAGQRHNTLVRYLAKSDVSRLVRVIATDRGQHFISVVYSVTPLAGRRGSSRRKSSTLTWPLPTLAAKSTSCDYCIVLTMCT